ncbi:hypothetical protein OIO90_001219 [Microbotryomycetes sp. JL221]|nr:hypothetical protein OIO90_001219 [Microbotryomycetes sp. JL221]
MTTIAYGIEDRDAYLQGRQAALEYCRQHGFPEWSMVEMPVQWSEQDPNNHLNNVVYAKYMETGRLTFIKSVHQQIKAQFPPQVPQSQVILARIELDYLKPTFSPDTMCVAHKCIEINERKMVLECMLFSYNQRAKVAQGKAYMIAFRYDLQKVGQYTKEFQTFVQQTIKPVSKL